jgi:hypothetical protein
VSEPPVRSVRITGQVIDFTGDPIPNASVTVIVGSPVSTKSDQDGTFAVTALVPDKFEVRVVSPGFKQGVAKVSTPFIITEVDLGRMVLEVPMESPIQVAPTFHGHYENPEYGYSVEIPYGLLGMGDFTDLTSSTSTEGFVITLGRAGYVWVRASHELPDLTRTSQTRKSKLGNLRAERRRSKNPDASIYEIIVGTRFDVQGPIIYTISVGTSDTYRTEAYRVFDAVVKSFCTIPVRPR